MDTISIDIMKHNLENGLNRCETLWISNYFIIDLQPNMPKEYNMKREYCGIGVINMKTEFNYGTLFRSAYCFGADFMFLIGKRFHKLSSDTTRAEKHIPLFEYRTIDDFWEHIPYNCIPIAIEISDKARDIKNFVHPERAVYILGQEDGSIPNSILDKCKVVLKIPTKTCLNVAVAGSIVLYDRNIK